MSIDPQQESVMAAAGEPIIVSPRPPQKSGP
jgi:hypothetical protein